MNNVQDNFVSLFDIAIVSVTNDAMQHIQQANYVREFFCGWRRKVGSILLLTALLAYGEWTRSYLYYDLIWIEAFSTSCRFVTKTGKFCVEISGVQFEELYGWRDFPVSEAENLMFGTANGPVRTSDANLPFWPFVLMLTLLSGSLILYPAHRSNRKSAKSGPASRGET